MHNKDNNVFVFLRFWILGSVFFFFCAAPMGFGFGSLFFLQFFGLGPTLGPTLGPLEAGVRSRYTGGLFCPVLSWIVYLHCLMFRDCFELFHYLDWIRGVKLVQNPPGNAPNGLAEGPVWRFQYVVELFENIENRWPTLGLILGSLGHCSDHQSDSKSSALE